MFSLFRRKKEEYEYIGNQWMSLFDRIYVPDYYKPYEEAKKDAAVGEITIIEERCDACGLCVRICPAETLVFKDRAKPLEKGKRKIKKVMSMMEEPLCIACGDCAAICPNDAIYVSQQMHMPKSIFKTINRGPLSLPRLFNEEKE